MDLQCFQVVGLDDHFRWVDACHRGHDVGSSLQPVRCGHRRSGRIQVGEQFARSERACPQQGIGSLDLHRGGVRTRQQHRLLRPA
ncbi:MAG TPA: hypothetical protein VKS82_22165 [Streptosporangiaceae bacterium]|nr:hypothetical protein [Streptosporangiaceae bacterium]